jgi:predicted P-loop ATPase/GTPase
MVESVRQVETNHRRVEKCNLVLVESFRSLHNPIIDIVQPNTLNNDTRMNRAADFYDVRNYRRAVPTGSNMSRCCKVEVKACLTVV